MQFFSVEPSGLIPLSPWGRFKMLPPLLKALIIIGLLAMAFVAYRALRRTSTTELPQVQSFLNVFVTPAYAQDSSTRVPSSPQRMSTEVRQAVLIGIIALLGIILILSCLTLLLTKDATKATVAGDIMKTILGFFIGVATTFF